MFPSAQYPPSSAGSSRNSKPPLIAKEVDGLAKNRMVTVEVQSALTKQASADGYESLDDSEAIGDSNWNNRILHLVGLVYRRDSLLLDGDYGSHTEGDVEGD